MNYEIIRKEINEFSDITTNMKENARLTTLLVTMIDRAYEEWVKHCSRFYKQ